MTQRANEAPSETCPFVGLDEAASLERLRAMSSPGAPATERAAFLAHLDRSCPRCDEVLAAEGAAPILAALASRVEAGLPSPRPGELAAVYGRIEAALAPAPARLSFAVRAWQYWRGAAVAAGLAAVVVVALVVLRPGGEPWREKGVAWPAPALLLFHGTTTAAGPTVAGPVAGPLTPGDAVLFRVRLLRPGAVVLAVVRPGGAVTELHTATLAAGEHEVAAEGHALAYPVSERGVVIFRLAHGADLAAARRALTRGAAEPPGEGAAAVDAVVRVGAP